MSTRHSAGILGLLLLLGGLVSQSRLMADEESPSAGKPLDVGSQRILFVDDTFIAEKSGVELKLHTPRKTGEQLIVSEHPWESATLNWFSVLQDGGKYRMWYECYDVDGWPTADDTSFCYAESIDGVHWSIVPAGTSSRASASALTMSPG